MVFPCRNCLFNDLTLHLKDVFSTSSCILVSLMAQWISMCTMSIKGLGFKSHGSLQWSFLAEKASLMTSHLCSNLAEGSSYNSIFAFGLIIPWIKLDLIKLIKGKFIFPAPGLPRSSFPTVFPGGTVGYLQRQLGFLLAVG